MKLNQTTTIIVIALFSTILLGCIIKSAKAIETDSIHQSNREKFYASHERKLVNNREIFVKKDPIVREYYNSVPAAIMERNQNTKNSKNYVREINRWQNKTPQVIHFVRTSIIEQEYDIENSGTYKKYRVGYVKDSPEDAYRIAALQNKKHNDYEKKFYSRDKMLVFSRYIDENQYESIRCENC